MSGLQKQKPSFVLWLFGLIVLAPGLFVLIGSRFRSGPSWAYIAIAAGVLCVFVAAYLHDVDHRKRGESPHAFLGRR